MDFLPPDDRAGQVIRGAGVAVRRTEPLPAGSAVSAAELAVEAVGAARFHTASRMERAAARNHAQRYWLPLPRRNRAVRERRRIDITRLRRSFPSPCRHPEKGRSLFRGGSDMRFAFIARHRNIWPVACLANVATTEWPASRTTGPSAQLAGISSATVRPWTRCSTARVAINSGLPAMLRRLRRRRR